MKIGLQGPQDILALLVRRRWWVIAPFLALTAAIAILTYHLPKVYVSETLILVRPRDIPKDFVKDLISGTAQERLKAIEQTILSRTNLVQTLREFGDQLPEFDRLNMDEKVVKLRGQINIEFTLEKANGVELPLSYFRILYQNQNPELAQKIAGKLTTLFIDQDNKTRETQVFGTTEFLAAELAKVSGQLTESEARLKEVKSSRQFELPDQREANLRTLDRLSAEKKTNAEALDRFLTNRLNIETLISQTPPTLPRPVPPAPAAKTPVKNLLVEDYRKAELEYNEAAAKYTAIHPEVLSAKAHLERLKQQIPPELLAAAQGEAAPPNETDPANAGMPNPLFQSLIAQLEGVKTELKIREQEKTWIASEIGKYSQRVENTPKTEQDMVDVQRRNDDLKKEYDDLNGKLSQARLSESLESKQKGSQFQIVDPANYPLTPAKPNTMSVLLGGSLFSLLLAIGLAVGVDVARQKVWTQSQIEALWGVPVLVDIPEILTDADLALRRRKTFVHLAASLAGVFAYSFCLYGVYLKHAFILRQLDPVIQKLVYK